MPPVCFAPAPPWDVASTPAAARRGFPFAMVRGLYAAALRRPAAVVRDRRHVLDGLDVETAGGEGADGRLAARTRPLHLHVDRADAVLLRKLCRVLGGHLRGEGGAFARPLEADAAGARPGQDVPHRVAGGDDGIVERRGDRGHAVRNVFAMLLLGSRAAGAGFGCSCSSHGSSVLSSWFLG